MGNICSATLAVAGNGVDMEWGHEMATFLSKLPKFWWTSSTPLPRHRRIEGVEIESRLASGFLSCTWMCSRQANLGKYWLAKFCFVEPFGISWTYVYFHIASIVC